MSITDEAEPHTSFGERVGGEDFGKPDGSAKPRQGGVTCSVCGRYYRQNRGLATHMRREHGVNLQGEPVAATQRETQGTDAQLRQAAMEFAQFIYGMGGGMIAALGDPICGQAVQRSANQCGQAWYEAAKKNRHVRQMIEGTGHLGVWGGLILAHWPIIQTVQQHHISGAQLGGNSRVQPPPQDAGSAYAQNGIGEPVVFDSATE